jgi:hypothetical protein
MKSVVRALKPKDKSYGLIRKMTNQQLMTKLKDVLIQRDIDVDNFKSGGKQGLTGITFKEKIRSPLQVSSAIQEVSLDELDRG